MSQEVQVSAALRWEEGDDRVEKAYRSVLLDSTGTHAEAKIQTIGTSEETITFADVGSGPYVLLRNLDDTNYVTIASGSGVAALIRLKAGEIALFPVDASATLYATADTANCRLEITAAPATS